MRPGSDPLGNLARALSSTEVFGSEEEENRQIQAAITEATLRRGSLGLVEAVRQNRLPPNESLLVVVDQFEELFRFARVSASERYRYEAAAFVKLLLEAARQREQNVYVVLTMRSDFLGDCSIFWGLPEAVNEGQYLIPRMTRDQRAEAITGPIAVCGGHIAQRLVNRLLNDTGDNPDMLPILQHALMRTWENWASDHGEGEPVDLRHYEAVGTMSDALSLHADEAFNELPDERSRLIAERVFKALTEKGEDNREVRRPTVLAELCAQADATPAEVVPVIEVFRREGRSFLMPPPPAPLDEESLIDISHESLIRNWQRLKEWVEQESGCAQIYRHLAETAVLFERGEAGLWRDPDLQLGLDWREKHGPQAAWATRYHPAYDSAMTFLDASVKARDDAAREKEQRRRREIRRTRIAAFFFMFLFAVSFAALLIAARKSKEAQTAADRNRHLLYAADLNLAQQAYDSGNITRARELLDAHKPGGADTPGFEWYYLWHLLHRETESLKVELREGHKLQSAALTGDGKTLFVNKGDGVELWDVASRRKLRSIDKDSEMTATDISPDGRLLVFGGNPSSAVTLVDVATGQELQQLGGENDDALRVPDKEFEGGVSVVKFSPDGATLAVGTELSSVHEPKVTLWDVASRRRKVVFKDENSIVSIAFSTDGSLIAAGGVGGSIRVWDASSAKELCRREQRQPVSSVAFSPSGRYLAIGYGASSPAMPVLLSLSECRSEPSSNIIGYSLEGAGTEAAGSVAFSPDDRLLAVSYGDNSVKVWEVAFIKDGPVVAVKGHAGYINLAAFLSNSHTLLTAAEDGTINLWDTSELILEHKTLLGHTGAIVGLAFSPDGRTLASTGFDKTVKLWRAATDEEVKSRGSQ